MAFSFIPAFLRRGRSPRHLDSLNSMLAESCAEGEWDKALAHVRDGAVSGRLHCGHSAIFWAAKAGHKGLVLALAPMAHWGSESDGQTALMAACWLGEIDVVTALLLSDMPSGQRLTRDSRGTSALDFASAHGGSEIVSALLSTDFPNGPPPSRNDRWAAAGAAAAFAQTEVLDIFERRGWLDGDDVCEPWRHCQSLTRCSLDNSSMVIERATRGSGRLGGFGIIGCRDEDEFSWLDEDEDEDEHGGPALGFRGVFRKEPGMLVVEQCMRMDQALGSPHFEDWPLQTFFAAALAGNEQACLALIQSHPLIASSSGSNGNGMTALMAAAGAGMLDATRALLPLSDMAALNEQNMSALACSMCNLRHHSPAASVFAELAAVADDELWRREEAGIWRDLLTDPPSWERRDMLLAVSAAAKRSSPKALSAALATAIAEGRAEAVEFLFPRTSMEQNAPALISELIRRSGLGGQADAMSELAQRACLSLVESEVLAFAAPELSASPKPAARRI